MLSDDPVKCPDVLQRSSHQACIRDAVTIVGENPYSSAGPGHQPELSQLNSVQSFAHRAHRHDLRMPVPDAQRCNMLGCLRGVGNRGGVGHRQYGGESTAGSGQCAGLHGLGVLASRLTQVSVQVDQARQREESVGIQLLDVGCDVGAVHKPAVPDSQV
jgi:hypothetical protein